MSTSTPHQATLEASDGSVRSLRWARGALVVGFLSAVAFAAIQVFATISHDGGPFQYAADYWYTGVGLALIASALLLVVSVSRLEAGHIGRLARIGLALAGLALLELTVQLTAGLIAGAELLWGPIYVVATALSFVGLALFAVGSWRVGLLPRWILGLWPVVWIVGGPAAQGPTPLLLAAFYVAVWVNLRTRASRG